MTQSFETPLSAADIENSLLLQSRLAERGMATYPSVDRAAAALARFATWQDQRTR